MQYDFAIRVFPGFSDGCLLCLKQCFLDKIMEVPNAGIAMLRPCRDYSNVVRKPLLGKLGQGA